MVKPYLSTNRETIPALSMNRRPLRSKARLIVRLGYWLSHNASHLSAASQRAGVKDKHKKIIS